MKKNNYWQPGQTIVMALKSGGNMITLRVMATAFLSNGSDMLLMKRSANRKLAPGMWAAVGGHVETYEINTPENACLREVYEETGLCREDIINLKLRYIVLRRKHDEIRVQYIYFGEAIRKDVGKTEEGELFWIDFGNVPDLEMTPSINYVLKHYFEIGISNENVYTGTVSEADSKPVMNWAILKDYEKTDII